MRETKHILQIVESRGQKRLPLNKVIRLLCNQNLLLTAYGNLASKKGATTPGVDTTDTADDMSLPRIEKLIDQLRHQSYQWKPVRRVNIPKKSGGQRPRV